MGFLGVSKVVSEWFPKEQYARMIGFSFTFGLMGAIYGGKPISMLIEANSWQNVALTTAILSIAIGFVAYLILRSPTNAVNHNEEEQFKLSSFTTLLVSPVIWCLAIANLLMVGSLEGFADVWGVNYLMQAYSLTRDSAAGIMSSVFYGMLVGGPLVAFLSKKIGNYAVITACGLGMALAFVLLLFSYTYSWWMLSCLFFMVGIMCCYQVLVFAAGADFVLPKHLGVTIAFLNCVNMLGGSFFHTVIGKTMDIFWTGALGSDGVRLYELLTYKYALCVIPICSIIGAVMVGLIGVNLRNKSNLTSSS